MNEDQYLSISPSYLSHITEEEVTWRFPVEEGYQPPQYVLDNPGSPTSTPLYRTRFERPLSDFLTLRTMAVAIDSIEAFYERWGNAGRGATPINVVPDDSDSDIDPPPAALLQFQHFQERRIRDSDSDDSTGLPVAPPRSERRGLPPRVRRGARGIGAIRRPPGRSTSLPPRQAPITSQRLPASRSAIASANRRTVRPAPSTPAPHSTPTRETIDSRGTSNLYPSLDEMRRIEEEPQPVAVATPDQPQPPNLPVEHPSQPTPQVTSRHSPPVTSLQTVLEEIEVESRITLQPSVEETVHQSPPTQHLRPDASTTPPSTQRAPTTIEQMDVESTYSPTAEERVQSHLPFKKRKISIASTKFSLKPKGAIETHGSLKTWSSVEGVMELVLPFCEEGEVGDVHNALLKYNNTITILNVV